MNNNWESKEDLGLWLILLPKFGNCETMAEFSLNLWVREKKAFCGKVGSWASICLPWETGI